ncbi:bifunctional farnesyl-diphosphate farnesyltransferase/squalene synthase [Blastocladiella emersonii ATCC 22665]|nr:bifunctional farnesyl-diphosphate farnesyltransferase/squalene synthase [Blastocladiella emersonii ATCC 22665]
MMSTLLKSALHPTEVVALVQYALAERRAAKPARAAAAAAAAAKAAAAATTDPATAREDEGHAPDTLARCYYYLDRTSRSFAAVIRALHPDLRDAVCIFYLALRGLDTIEDDMTIPLPRKLAVLARFHEHLATPGWTFSENALADKDRDLLLEFNVVVDQFLRLPPPFRAVIADITEKMATGMAYYCQRAYEQDQAAEAALAAAAAAPSATAAEAEAAVLLSGNRVQTIAEYNEYCYYVAGLVGHGLTRLFLASGLETSPALAADDLYLANSMGLALQKVNITRDFYEDYLENRAFWPREIWGHYAASLGELLEPDNYYGKGRAALNHMCYNALRHVKDVLEYLAALRDPTVFKFCAIPQVMAIATIAEIYNNPRVFSGNVKIRKGMTVQLIMQATDIESVKRVFARFARDLQRAALAYQRELAAGGAKAIGVPTIVTSALPADAQTPLSAELALHEATHTAAATLALCTDLRVLCGDAPADAEAGARGGVVDNFVLAVAPTPRRAAMIRTAVSVAAVPVVAWFVYKRATAA